ncbi:enoyl-CoA hydratase/isomerase family protein [Paracoccus laeviglucosivorans]|uniref:Enoyl-CoA hydratase/carnithine racemase n=1 Tax=Paracoccus laeviglucosivorans TaxID=1197861 RepID=A0A521FBI5_9RHOB|nr:enoyl-CoA hydratase/isomerase family protein [Paracoccus laeviglucosivorans]SMO93515.1 Enoyl-CoA hydratase/carnithine racemase [Paracoccus laeviglucosivorans]
MFRVERRDQVAVIHLDNPPVNAVTFDRWRALPPLIAGLEREGIGAMVFTGLPQRHFCAGNDFREFAVLSPDETLLGTAAVRDALRAVRESPIIAVAALHGAAMGSGFMLACACDIRLATPDARLGLPEIKVGAIGGYRIAREVLGQAEARAMVLTGEPISGERAHQIGLVQAMGPTADQVLAQALDMALRMSQLIRGRLRAELKACMNAQDGQSLWQSYDLERELAARTMGAAAPARS